MEIVVEGKGKQLVTPDLIMLHLNFVTKGVTYEEVLEKGIENVQHFIELLVQNHFNKDDMKTRSFVIREDNKYNEVTRTYEKDGFSFNQQAFLTFDYNKDIMADLMVKLSKIENAPLCHLSFGVKEEKNIRRNILKDAYKEAEEQALAIALAAGKTLKVCEKIDFKPFSTSYISSSTLDGTMMRQSEVCYSGAVEKITNVFTPEDIELTETIYSLWIAE
ncbi:MAG: SIMPL domain-containing protein [Bacilli bacterium]|nr:SIMPL domain-containing protein [Bacilli bacterium]